MHAITRISWNAAATVLHPPPSQCNRPALHKSTRTPHKMPLCRNCIATRTPWAAAAAPPPPPHLCLRQQLLALLQALAALLQLGGGGQHAIALRLGAGRVVHAQALGGGEWVWEQGHGLLRASCRRLGWGCGVADGPCPGPGRDGDEWVRVKREENVEGIMQWARG